MRQPGQGAQEPARQANKDGDVLRCHCGSLLALAGVEAQPPPWTGFAMAWRRFRYRKRDAHDALTVEFVTARVEIKPAVIQTAPQTNETSKELARIDLEVVLTAPNGNTLVHVPRCAAHYR